MSERIGYLGGIEKKTYLEAMKRVQQSPGPVTEEVSIRKPYKLFEAHPDVIDPVQRRIASLMAMFHFASIPLAPLALFLTTYTKPSHVPMGVGWSAVVVGMAVLNYALARSRWYRVTIYGQLVVAFAVCFWTALQIPNRQSLHFTMVLLPILMAAHLMSYRELKFVTVWSVLGLVGLYFLVDADAQRLIVGSSFVLLVLVMLIIMIRHHQSWVERVRREKLGEEYARFQSLMEAAYDTTVTLVENRVAQVGQGAHKLFDRPVNELIGKSIDELLTLEDPSTPHFGETSILRPEGKIGYASFAVEPISATESFLALRDVTEERLQTAQQLQLDRMSQTATLASGIAHEFNTPLMVVMNQLRKAEKRLEGTDPELLKLLESSQAELNQLTGIVKDLKWFIQPSNDAYCDSPQKVIENAVRLAGHRIRHQSEVTIDHTAETPLAIADNQLSQLILNLLFNANEAKSPHRKRNTIHISSRVADNTFVLAVKDDGVGMPPAIQARVFQPFFTHGKLAGTGLGLSICHSIVSQVGGRIEISSKESLGTTITVFLPLAKHDDPTASDAHFKAIDAGTKLVIDDDQLLSSLVAEMLDDQNTLNLSSISEAIKIIENQNVNLILCDLNMPNGGAQAMYNHLMTTRHPAARRMIVMTGGAVDPVSQAFLNETDIPILYKPFGHSDIVRAVTRLSRE